MRVVELFAGIGGFRAGFQAAADASNRVISFPFVSEWDKFAQKSYEAIWGEVPHGDITKIEAKDIPDHDILVGGFPCQAFSTAGKMKGFEDARGTLFFDMARIAKEKQPKAILMENVKGLVGHDKGNTLDVMAKTLWDIGYRIDFDILNSCMFGVPQNRERIFIVAIRKDLINKQEWVAKGNTVVPKGKKRIGAFENADTFNFSYPVGFDTDVRLRGILEPTEDIPESMYIDQGKTDKLLAGLSEEDLEAALGLSIKEVAKQGYASAKEGDQSVVVPVITPERATKRQNGRRFKANGDDTFTLTAQDRHGVLIAQQEVLVGVDAHPFSKKLEFNGFKQSDKAGALLATDYKAPQCALVGLLEIKGTEQVRRVYDIGGLSPTLTTMQGGNQEPKIVVAGNVNPSGTGMNGVAYVADGLSPTLTTNKGEGPKILADEHLRGELEDIVRGIAKRIRPNEDIGVNFKGNGDIRPHRNDARKSGLSELTINYEGNTSATVTSAHAPKVYGESTWYRIRKLTPLECWRLQAFDDDMFYRAKNAGVSNSQLYKQAGNSVTTTVIKEIALKLFDLLDTAESGELAPPPGQTNIFDFI